MLVYATNGPKRMRGAAFITVLIFLLVTAILLSGIGMFAASHQARAHSDANYASALQLAEAGANTEFRKITLDPLQADQNWTTYTFGGGTYRVRVTQREANGTEVTPWIPPNDLFVYSRGTVDGVTREVKVSVKAFLAKGDYAVYGINSLNVQGNVQVTGDIGSNGPVTVGNSSDIDGSVYLNGPNATVSGASVPVYRDPIPTEWPTVDEIANQKFPQGGMNWLATHNDNMRATPPIIGNTINDNVTLPPGNYYVTNINLTGQREVSFNNSMGEINLWVGPSGGNGQMRFRGGSSGNTDVATGGHQINMFVATRSVFDMAGDSVLRANVYAYNRDGAGLPYGTIYNHGTADVYGKIIAYDVTLQGTPGIHYIPGTIEPTTIGYYGFDNSWEEVSGR